MSPNTTTPSVSPTSPAPAPTLKSERIQLRLRSLGWIVSTNRRLISRRFQFATQKEAMAFLNLALALAESSQASRRRPPAFQIRGSQVRMSISSCGPALAKAELTLARSVSLLG